MTALSCTYFSPCLSIIYWFFLSLITPTTIVLIIWRKIPTVSPTCYTNEDTIWRNIWRFSYIQKECGILRIHLYLEIFSKYLLNLVKWLFRSTARLHFKKNQILLCSNKCAVLLCAEKTSALKTFSSISVFSKCLIKIFMK